MQELTLTIFATFWMVIFGAFIGSGLQCAAVRYAKGVSWVKGRSTCDSCNKTLGVLDLIPVFSYLASKGKCRHCGERIPPSCLYAELISAACFGILGWHFGFSLELLMWAVFATLLIALSLIDVQMRIIPNKLLIAAAVNRVIWFFILQQPVAETFITVGLSAIIPVALLMLVLVTEKILKKEAMGGGDIKLLLVMALYLDWIQMLVALVLACILGVIAGKAKWGKTIPFGPSLSAGCIFAATLLQPVAVWYGSLF